MKRGRGNNFNCSYETILSFLGISPSNIEGWAGEVIQELRKPGRCTRHESKLHTPLFSQLPSSNLQKAPEKRTSSCSCHSTLRGPVTSSSARYTTTDVSCRVRGGPTVILYSNIQKGELRKSEAAPVFKVYACQPLSTTGTLTHKGPSWKPVSSKFPKEIPLTIAYPQRNIHHPSC